MANLDKLLSQTGGIRPGLTGCEQIRCVEREQGVWDCRYGGFAFRPSAPATPYEPVDRSTGQLPATDFDHGYVDVVDALKVGIEPQPIDGQADTYYEGYNQALSDNGLEQLDAETIDELQNL